MKRRLLLVALLVMMLAVAIRPAPVIAADYRFQVNRAQVVMTINKDGTVSFDYTYDFYNYVGAHEIDYVDIGVPQSSDYNLGAITAEVDGKRINDIQNSEVVKPGIALGLGINSIKAGANGRVHAKINAVRKVIYWSDLTDTKEKYASVSVSPNWFDGAYSTGQTDYTFTILFPPDLETDEPRYHIPQTWPGSQAPFTGVDQTTGLKFYSWQNKSANAYTQYIFGASFPARLVPENMIQTKPWITLPPLEDLICFGIGGFFVIIFGLSIYGSVWGARKRKLQYLPPKIAIEGMGIKRGLTAVEAAILMEQPLDKILTMILFSSIKKQAASVVTKDPLKINVVDPLPEGLYAYEKEFLFAFKEDKLTARRKLLQTMMINLVKSIQEKMKGFNRKESVAYYESIMKTAWQQIESAATPEVRMQAFDDNLDWTLLDRRFEDRTRDVFRTGPVYAPTWWHHYDPTFRPSVPTTSGGGGQPITISRPNIPGADFAASVVNGVQGFAAGVVGDVNTFTGGVTDKTNPVPVTNYSSGGSTRSGGGGSSCACACACACAGCACACAGGGR